MYLNDCFFSQYNMTRLSRLLKSNSWWKFKLFSIWSWHQVPRTDNDWQPKMYSLCAICITYNKKSKILHHFNGMKCLARLIQHIYSKITVLFVRAKENDALWQTAIRRARYIQRCRNKDENAFKIFKLHSIMFKYSKSQNFPIFRDLEYILRVSGYPLPLICTLYILISCNNKSVSMAFVHVW